MLKGQEGTRKHQHYHIKACLTKSKSLTHTISTSSFVRALSFHSLYCMYLLAFLQICADIHPNKFFPQRTQTTDILHEQSVDSRRQLCSLLLQCNKSDFTLVSYSLTAFSSLRLPVVFPFEADLISHIRTSIFLKRAE